MSPRHIPKCVDCEKTESLLWRNAENGQICQECFERKEKADADTVQESSLEAKSKEDKQKDKESNEIGSAGSEIKSTTIEDKRLRKSTRATRFKNKANSSSQTNGSHNNGSNSASGNSIATTTNVSNKSQSKGRNRRNLFKRTPLKTPVAQATTHYVESVFHKGSYIQVGDIVSLIDSDQNLYYAQIRGLLIDNYCEKSAFLSWLIPTQASPDPNEGFDAATYLIGPDEELSRKLSCMEFVMHAPSNYYLDRTTPFPLPDSMDYENRKAGFMWTTMPETQRKKSSS